MAHGQPDTGMLHAGVKGTLCLAVTFAACQEHKTAPFSAQQELACQLLAVNRLPSATLCLTVKPLLLGSPLQDACNTGSSEFPLCLLRVGLATTLLHMLPGAAALLERIVLHLLRSQCTGATAVPKTDVLSSGQNGGYTEQLLGVDSAKEAQAMALPSFYLNLRDRGMI